MKIREEKREIRKKILTLRDGMNSDERKRASLLLTERIAGHQWFYRSDYFLGFVSCGSEISTLNIIEEALKSGKKVYVPKVHCRKDGAEMRFFRITSIEELEPGYRGIPEPAGGSEEYKYSDSVAERTLMLMPGVAFDRYRGRLGYGKGFYDRYLAGRPGLRQRTIAVGYRCQMVEKLPEEETDIRPCQVICL